MSTSKSDKEKILVCGILPPPNFGHSMMYKMLMESSFVKVYDVTFLNMHFWTYGKHKKVTIDKLVKMVKYLVEYVFLILTRRPRYVLFNMSFDKMPFLKDYLYCKVGRLLGCKIILHDMGQYLPELTQGSSGFLKFFIKDMLRITTAIIVMGEKVKGEYRPFIATERLVVVPGCVEDSVALNVPLERKKDPQEIRVLYFSFLSVSKGVWTALKSIPLVLAQNKNITFTLAGPVESDELLAQVNGYIATQGLQERVSYVGYVSSVEDRTQYFRNTDIFIFPTHRDVFGLVLLHAMAESIPVVASREGTIPEIVIDGKSGLLFEKGNHEQLAAKVLKLSQDNALRKKMGEVGRQKYLDAYAPHIYGKRMAEAFCYIQSLH